MKKEYIEIIMGSIVMGLLYFYLNSRICRNTFLDVLLLIVPTICIIMFPLLYLNYKRLVDKS